jgi:hypothetical protein
MSNSNLLNDLTIGNLNGTIEVTRRNVNGFDESPSYNTTRFSEVDGSVTLQVGPDHELYRQPVQMSYDVSTDPDFNPTDGFISKTSGRHAGDLTDAGSMLLRVNGVEMDIPTAMAQGLVAKTNNGYTLTGKDQGRMKQNAEVRQQAKDSNTVVVDTKARTPHMAKLENTIGAHATHNLVSAALSAGSDGRGMKDITVIESAAKAAGMSTKDVANAISDALKASESRAMAALQSANIDPEPVFQHLYERVDAQTRASILSALVAGDASALNYMLQLYQTGNRK